MKITLKTSVNNDKIQVAKGTEGLVVAITNSPSICEWYGADKGSEWYYLVEFPKIGRVLCSDRQVLV